MNIAATKEINANGFTYVTVVCEENQAIYEITWCKELNCYDVFYSKNGKTSPNQMGKRFWSLAEISKNYKGLSFSINEIQKVIENLMVEPKAVIKKTSEKEAWFVVDSNKKYKVSVLRSAKEMKYKELGNCYLCKFQSGNTQFIPTENLEFIKASRN